MKLVIPAENRFSFIRKCIHINRASVLRNVCGKSVSYLTVFSRKVIKNLTLLVFNCSASGEESEYASESECPRGGEYLNCGAYVDDSE